MTPYKVTLRRNVHKAIQDEIQQAIPLLKDGGETGGWLWAPQGAAWWGEDGIDVREASGPGPNPEVGFETMTLGAGYMHDLDELFRREGLELCGGWQTHPSGDDQPSTTDPEGRITKVLQLRHDWESRTQRALEIIFTPPKFGRGDWTAHPWVFHYGQSRIGRVPGPQPEPAIIHGGR